MRAAHLRQRTVVRASDPMPDLRHDPHRAPGSSASGSRCARSPIAGPSTSSVPRPQAFCRGDPGRAFDCPGNDPTQTTRGAPTEKQKPSAEICCLCHRVGRAGWGRLPLPAILAEQDTGQREFQTDRSASLYSSPEACEDADIWSALTIARSGRPTRPRCGTRSGSIRNARRRWDSTTRPTRRSPIGKPSGRSSMASTSSSIAGIAPARRMPSRPNTAPPSRRC